MVNVFNEDWHLEDYGSANYSNESDVEGDPGFVLKHGLTTTTILCIAYSIEFGLGLLGNCFVVAVVIRSPRMRSPTNLFIVNLACADLLVNVLCLPFTLIANLIPAWVLGGIICKGVAYFQGVSVSASVNTLLAISLERCKAISSPLSGSMTTRSCRIVVTIIWIFALSINLPWIVVFTLEPIGITGSKAQICTELWPNQESEKFFFIFANLVVCYLFPLFVILACYIQMWRRVSLRRMPGAVGGQIILNRSKVKVLKMLFVVVVTFALSWLPLYVVFFIVKFGLSSDLHPDHIIITIIPMAQWLGAFNSCINPIIYAFFNRRFRAGFKAIITSRSCCSTLQHEKYNSCYQSCDNRLRSINLTVIKNDKFEPSYKKKMTRSKSAHNDCNISSNMGQRSKSINLSEHVDIPMKILKHKNEMKHNGASKV